MEINEISYYPMKMQPVYKDYIWGGQRLRNLNKISESARIAESWEISCNEAGLTTVANGIYAGKTLKSVVELSWEDFLGERYHRDSGFPLILKFIDAQKDLSVQVHPSEQTADVSKGEFCKSELWYIIDCEPDSYIYYGLKNDISKEEFLRRAQEKTICEVLNKIEVKKGEAYYIPAGVIHALGHGILVAEIQQNSNTTFRIYDYDRRDSLGNLRELHVERAKDVVCLEKMEPDVNLKENFTAFECDYFKVKKEIINGRKVFENLEKKFSVVQIIFGKGKIESEDFVSDCEVGDTFFIPAKLKKYTISGKCELLITQV